MEAWLSKNGLQLNFDKIQIMEFSGTKHNTIIFPNIVKFHEFQGIKLNKHINWKAQLTWTI